MKQFLKTICALLLALFAPLSAQAWTSSVPHLNDSPFTQVWLHHGFIAPPSQNVSSLIGPNGGGDFPFINNVKMGATQFAYGTGGAPLRPDEVDSNGYPLPGGAWTTTGGAVTLISTPSQFSYPGHIVVQWNGQANPIITQNGSGVTRIVSCAGGNGTNFGNGVKCDNTACSTFTGSIAATTLTVTAAPTGTGCGLGINQPFAWGAGFTGGTSQFGTSTVIVGNSSVNSNLCSPSCTGAGGTGTYAVNQSQAVASTTMLGGAWVEINVTAPFVTTGSDSYKVQYSAVGAGSQYLQNLAIFNIADEARYQASATPCGGGKACIVSAIFQTRVQSQANFGAIRDLDWTGANGTSCSTWGTRKPPNYWAYNVDEIRNAASGTTTYTAGGQVYTIPKEGQYIDSGGTGASGGTVSYAGVSTAVSSGTYNSGTGLVTLTMSVAPPFITGDAVSMVLTGTGSTSSLNKSFTVTVSGTTVTYTAATGLTVTITGGNAVSTDTYSITLGSGNFVDKQTFLMLVPTTGTSSSTVSLNGNTAIVFATSSGILNATPPTPSSTAVFTYFYDALLNKLLAFTQAAGNNGGMHCGPPPEVFAELNAELNTNLHHVLPYLALDPMTDWVSQYANYVKVNYPSMVPRFEVTNEPFNCAAGPANAYYLSAKSEIYVAEDAAWNGGIQFCGPLSPPGDNPDEIGKMASTTGQDLVSVLGAGHYELLIPVQTEGTPSGWARNFTSSGYVNQTIAPTQTGYTRTPAYNYATRVSLGAYWTSGVEWENSFNNGSSLAGLEVGYAYCYYFYTTSAACQGKYVSQAAVMTAYMNTSSATICGGELCSWGNIPNMGVNTAAWQTAALVCFSGTRPGSCVMNQTKASMGYEGGYSPNTMFSLKGVISSIINASGDILQPLAGATSNGADTDLILHNNGCVVGQTIALSGLVGGTWSTANGNYVVSAVSGDTCKIPLNSSTLGTFGTGTTTSTAGWTTASTAIPVASCTGIIANQRASDTTTGKYIGTVSSCAGLSMSLKNYPAFNAGSNNDTITFVTTTGAIATYTNSYTWITTLRGSSYTAPELDALTTSLYTTLDSAGLASIPQYQLSSGGYIPGNGNSWNVFANNIYGAYPMATCSSCTAASTTLTLGGTILGIFGVGQTLIGSTVPGPGTGASATTITAPCTPIGSNVCGTTAGDTFGLSQTTTVSPGAPLNGAIVPGAPGSGTVSPIRSFHGICAWNGNGAAC